jgi:hypothetical protein
VKPNYTYNAFYQECFGQTVSLLVDLGFGRYVPMQFRLCDVAPVEGKPMHWYIDTWMREDRHVRVESVRRDDSYAAHIYRGTDCLNVALREAGYAVPA